MEWSFNDGGREAAGYKGATGDCGVRALSIATDLNYQEAYDLVKVYAAKERPRKGKKRSHPRTGIWARTYRKILEDLDWEWVPTMEIGTGCRVHLRKDELPARALERSIVRVSKHYAAILRGVVQDRYIDAHNGTRCVYGYWVPRN